MQVRKRNGELEPVDVNKIVRAVERCVVGLDDVDPLRVATRTISGLYDGATTAELDRLSIRTAAELIGEEPRVLPARRTAARRLHRQGGPRAGHPRVQPEHRDGPVAGTDLRRDRRLRGRQRAQARRRDRRCGRPRFEYFGLRTVYDRYLLRHPHTRAVIETPQVFMLRVACGLARTPVEAISLYRLMSSLAYLPSSPTLFNSGTTHPQMSSCYLVDSPKDELDSIYDRYAQVARLSKFAGGIGIQWSRVRSRGALIRARTASRTASCRGCAPWTPPSPRSTRAAGARAPRACTSRPGIPTSRSSSSCETTPARTPAARTTSTWRTGCRTSSCAGSSPTASGR